MILGLDVSTSCTGICVISDSGELVKLDWVKLSKEKDLISKAQQLRNALENIRATYNITYIFIEEPLQRFSMGASSAATITKLASFNGISQYLCYSLFNITPELLNVTRARKSLNIKTMSKKKAGKSVKEQVFDWVSDYLKYDWPTKILKSGPRRGQKVILDECLDMADAFVIAKSGFVKLKDSV